MDLHRLTLAHRSGSGVKTGVATPQALGLDGGGARTGKIKKAGGGGVPSQPVRLTACALAGWLTDWRSLSNPAGCA